MGIECGGYGIRLRWKDETASGPAAANLEGRGKIKLGMYHFRCDGESWLILVDTKAGSRYSLKEVDGYLVDIDNDSMAEDPKSTIRGPFCMFPSLGWKKDNNTRKPILEPTIANQENSSYDNNPVPQSGEDIEEIILGPQSTNIPSPTNTEWGVNLSGTMPVDLDTNEVVDIPMDECEYLDVSEDLSATNTLTLMISPPTSNGSVSRNLVNLPMDRISTSLSNNPLIDLLMHHYIVNVSDLLLPVRHSRNPYRNIYAPAALEVANGLTPTSGVNVALYHSLLASSAFHLWHCNPGLLNFYQIGTEYNERAVHCLRSSISDTTVSATDYRSLLMTILSLVDNGVSIR